MVDLILALTFLLFAIFSLIAEMRQIRLTKGIQEYIMKEWTNRKNIGHELIEAMDSYFLEHENPEDQSTPTRLESISQMMGARMRQGFSMSNAQAKSASTRVQNRYDRLVKDGIQEKMPPLYKVAKKAADYFGLNFDEILEADEVMPFIESLKKNGLGNMVQGKGNNGFQSQAFEFKVE